MLAKANSDPGAYRAIIANLGILHSAQTLNIGITTDTGIQDNTAIIEFDRAGKLYILIKNHPSLDVASRITAPINKIASRVVGQSENGNHQADRQINQAMQIAFNRLQCGSSIGENTAGLAAAA